MKILLIGTPTCIKCKEASIKLDIYCKEHDIEYSYIYLNNTPKDIVAEILSLNIRQAPVLMVYDGDNHKVSSGDDALSEVDSLVRNP